MGTAHSASSALDFVDDFAKHTRTHTHARTRAHTHAHTHTRTHTHAHTHTHTYARRHVMHSMHQANRSHVEARARNLRDGKPSEFNVNVIHTFFSLKLESFGQSSTSRVLLLLVLDGPDFYEKDIAQIS